MLITCICTATKTNRHNSTVTSPLMHAGQAAHACAIQINDCLHPKHHMYFWQTKLQGTGVLVVTHPDNLSLSDGGVKACALSTHDEDCPQKTSLGVQYLHCVLLFKLRKDKQPVYQEQRQQQESTLSRVTKESETWVSICIVMPPTGFELVSWTKLLLIVLTTGYHFSISRQSKG